MVARLFTDEQEKEICRRYKEGESAIKIGKNLGASNSCISNIVKRNNEQMRRSGALALDLVNKRFGELIVKKISKRRTPSGAVYWWCICNCGKKREVPSERLSHKKLKYGKNVTACVDCSLKRRAPSPERLLQEENARREENAILREKLKGQVPNDWLLLPLTEAQAKELKETKFFTGKPCPKGHISLKRIDGGCAECERLKMKEYSKRPEVSERRREKQRERMKDPEYKKKIQNWNKEYTMNRDLKCKITRSMCNAIQELHSLSIIHCDVKLKNMLYLEEEEKVILIDFGASLFLNDQKYIYVDEELGTRGYMSPELYNGYGYLKSDIYSKWYLNFHFCSFTNG